MALLERIPDDDLALGLVLMDPLLILLQFWQGDVTMRDGYQHLSLEQRLFLCDESDRVLLCTGRKIGKTMSLERDFVQIGMVHQKQGTLDEGLFFTPAQAHMNPVRDRIFSKIYQEPIFQEMVARTSKGNLIMSKGDGVVEFVTGFKWHLRIEGLSGSDVNMVGLRSMVIIGDEMAFGIDACHKSRVNTALPGCRWKYCGVPNGVRGTPFWRLDQTPEGQYWSRHKYTQYINPIFDPQSERRKLVQDHGGEHTQSYITQVLGQWGDEAMSSFPPSTIATYDDRPYFLYNWNADMGKHNAERGYVLDTIAKQVSTENRVVIGWDYGVSPDPAVIVMFVEDDPGVWYLRAMFVLRQVTSPHQISFVDQIADRFNVAFVVTDEAILVQQLEHSARWTLYDDMVGTGNVQWANLNGRIELLDSRGEVVLDELGNTIREQRKKWSTDELRNAMIHAREKLQYPYKVMLPEEDDYFLAELLGTTERKTVGGYTQYVTAKMTEGSKSPDDHRTDACRFAVLGIYSLLGARAKDRRPPFSAYRGKLGWRGGRQGWQPPWDRN